LSVFSATIGCRSFAFFGCCFLVLGLVNALYLNSVFGMIYGVLAGAHLMKAFALWKEQDDYDNTNNRDAN